MIRILLVLILSLSFSGALFAEMYKWVDEEGNVHYGDCPPADCKPEKIEATPSPSEEDAQQSRDRLEKLLDQQRQSEELRRKAAEDKKQERAAEQREKVERKKRCILARQNLHVLEIKRAVYFINEKGEREYLDDEARTAEIERLKKEVEKYCN